MCARTKISAEAAYVANGRYYRAKTAGALELICSRMNEHLTTGPLKAMVRITITFLCNIKKLNVNQANGYREQISGCQMGQGSGGERVRKMIEGSKRVKKKETQPNSSPLQVEKLFLDPNCVS